MSKAKEMMMKKVNVLCLCIVTIFISACREKVVKNEEKSHIVIDDTVFVKDEILKGKLKKASAKSYSYSKEITAAGTVQAIPTRFAYITPPFSGRVIKSHVSLGQKVKEGMPLYEINSPDFINTQKEFFQSSSSKELVKKEFLRKEELAKAGVCSMKELEEAKNSLLMAEKEYENIIAALNVYQIDNPEAMKLGQPLIIKSPVSGNIVENNIVNGQYIKDDSDPIAIVADLSRVWISAQVKEKDISYLKKGDILNFEVSARPGVLKEGEIFHIDDLVDESTRSIRVISVCDNDYSDLKIGMYATVKFFSEETEAVSVSENALMQNEKFTYVYKEIASDTYLRTPVGVGNTQNGIAIISSGLTKEDIIISEGGYYLK